MGGAAHRKIDDPITLSPPGARKIRAPELPWLRSGSPAGHRSRWAPSDQVLEVRTGARTIWLGRGR